MMSHREAHSYDEHEHYHDEPDHSDSNSAATDELEEEEEDDECPLCMEPFDATDREFAPCKCGYKICLWCWDNLNNIYTNTSSSSSSSTSSLLSSSSADRPPLAGRCPACRQPYQYPEMTFNAAALQSSLTAKQQKKAHRDKHKRDKSTAHTAASSTSSTAASSVSAASTADAHSRSSSDNSTRVLQRNLMYVANLPAAIAKEELLEDKRYFGKFGKITKIAITRKSGTNSTAGGSYSAYVTFKRAADCAVALQLCHHTLLQGQVVKCMYGTTKYCPFWLRSVPCTMNRCGYLHALASPEDVVGKEELQAMERKGDNEKPVPFPLQTTVTEALAAAKAYKSVQPAEDNDLSSTSAASSSTATTSTSSTVVTPPASVWKLPVAPSITASSSATSASSSTAAAASSGSASSSSLSTAGGSLRPYVSILAQSQNAIQSPSSTVAASIPASSVTNEIIRIVPSYLKDKFTPTATPSTPSQLTSTAAPSGRRKGGSTSSTATATASPALSPVSTASITASPTMSRSTSKASSASSRASSPIPSPLLQPVDANASSLSHSPPPPAPHSARSVVSPLPPAALSPTTSVASLASSTFSEQQQPQPQPLPQSSQQSSQPAVGVPSADEYQFDFLLYSQFDFSSFFSSYAANEPLFSWLCTPSHTAVHPFARARLSQQRSESRFEFARAGREGGEEESHREVDSKEAGKSGVDAAMSKQADSAWNEQKVDPAGGQGAVTIQQVSGRRAR